MELIIRHNFVEAHIILAALVIKRCLPGNHQIIFQIRLLVLDFFGTHLRYGLEWIGVRAALYHQRCLKRRPLLQTYQVYGRATQ